MNTDSLAKFYAQEIEANFWPFWEKAVDEEYGGVFTCFNNEGSELASTTKYIWSQGRFLWLVSELFQLAQSGSLRLSPKRLEKMAEQTYGFLKSNALMDNNHALYALTQDGGRIQGEEDLSVFADYFFVLGMNKYAEVFRNQEAFELAKEVYVTIKKRIASGSFDTAPYPIPDGFASHSLLMIQLNVVQELELTAKQFDSSFAEEAGQDVKRLVSQILHEFITEDGRIVELKSDDVQRQTGSLLGRHVNPGHTLESIWFQLHSLDHWNVDEQQGVVDKLSQAALRAADLGWDHEYGGLLRFVDQEGGQPSGQENGAAYERLIIDTWDTKLWWPHSEALYTMLLLYKTTGNDSFKEWYGKLEDYIFTTFPNPDPAIKEWIQIRDRNGEPLNKVVALPVKDPFHIVRNFILIIKLLSQK